MTWRHAPDARAGGGGGGLVLRTNLSTRPFYNERVVHLLIALAGVIVLTVTLFNVVKVVQLSRQQHRAGHAHRRTIAPRPSG